MCTVLLGMQQVDAKSAGLPASQTTHTATQPGRSVGVGVGGSGVGDVGGVGESVPESVAAAAVASTAVSRSSRRAEEVSSPIRTPVPLLLPQGSKLQLQPEGAAFLAQLPPPVRVTAVIGQYRSGKSFLLNQLAGVPCSSGFAVGHARSTQTKGVWASARPLPADSGGGVELLLDTEGFDATGHAAAYDDRIFAFAVLVADVIIYNLVETLKEADIEKLAFAAQLAHEFWRRASERRGTESSSSPSSSSPSSPSSSSPSSPSSSSSSSSLPSLTSSSSSPSSRGGAWSAPSLLWLVQRDFLEGSSVEEHVRSSLQPVRASDEQGERLNKIRFGLRQFGATGGLGLVQPHLRRTSLCELPNSQLAAEYTQGIARVRAWVAEHAAATAARRGAARSGASVRDQVERLVAVLNAQAIPTAGSVIDAFNREASLRALEKLRADLRALVLPRGVKALEAEAETAVAAARAELGGQLFGESGAPMLYATYDSGAAEEVKHLQNANFRASHTACAALWRQCEASVARLSQATLPSRRRYDARLAQCNVTMHACVGPASAEYAQRLAALSNGGATAYGKDFYAKVSHLFTLACALGILTFRYVLQVAALELLSWIALITVEVLPRVAALTQLSADAPSFWESRAGARLLACYEAAVYNSYFDADDWIYAPPCLLLLLCLCARVHACRRARRVRKPRSETSAQSRRLVQRSEDGSSEDER